MELTVSLHHNTYVTEGVAKIHEGLAELRKSYVLSNTPSLGAIIHEIEKTVGIVDGRNQVYPYEPGEEVNWAYNSSTKGVALMYKGASWDFASPEEAHKHALEESFFWRNKSTNLKIISEDALRAWSDIVDVMSGLIDGTLKV